MKALKTHPLADRNCKVSIDDFAKAWQAGSSLSDFIAGLPDILAGKNMRAVIRALVKAYQDSKTIVWAMGAHVIKVGLNPVIIDLMQHGVINAIALNGAGIIHDTELAMVGRTSENVEAALKNGSFGMAHETGHFICQAIRKASEHQIGLGEAMGKAIHTYKLPYAQHSILAAGIQLGIPVTVHIAIGTDTIHMHPEFDAGCAGQSSHMDFRTFAAIIATLEQGVYMNIGSAVILPEVFLKAISLARNLGHPLCALTTVNMDFIPHYRTLTNVVDRPTAGKNGFNLIGHHEIMLPLIAAGVIDQINP